MSSSIYDMNNIAHFECEYDQQDCIKQPSILDYQDTIYVLRYLLREMSNATFEDDKTKLTEKLFSYLIKNPIILIYEPKVREAIIKKMGEMRQYITLQTNTYDNIKFNEAILLMNKTIYLHVNNVKLRSKAFLYLNKVKKMLNCYSLWNQRDNLLKLFELLDTTLNDIKSHPNYVADL
jgi:hypothetical protein